MSVVATNYLYSKVEFQQLLLLQILKTEVTPTRTVETLDVCIELLHF